MADYQIPKRTCVRCGNYWDGWGGVCNQCRTIEAIKKQGTNTGSLGLGVKNPYSLPESDEPKFNSQAELDRYRLERAEREKERKRWW